MKQEQQRKTMPKTQHYHLKQKHPLKHQSMHLFQQGSN